MYERDKTSRAVPCWLIFDDRYRKRYAHLRSQPGSLPAAAARERAAEAGVDAGRPRPAVRHRRRRPRRDRRALQRARRATASTPTTAAASPPTTGRWAIPTARCTPASARSTSPPTTPARSLPGDIGTCGGLVTDEHARVLDEQDQPIDGLYATGQQHRHGHGPPLPRPGREHRQHAWCSATSRRGMLRGSTGREEPSMADELAGKVAIVTGGGSGIGRAMRRAVRRGGRPGRHRRHRRRGRPGRGRRARRRRRLPADRRHRRRPGAGARRLHRRALRRPPRDGEQRRRRQRDDPLPARRPERLRPGGRTSTSWASCSAPSGPPAT